ncbi:MAG TPA: MarP family serine protease [Solirubrobacteraceae bacterium]|nr:MarP family serine protease [Solirubrobacteraceae bacterium]
MTSVDWVIVVFTALLALYGGRRGLVVGGLTLGGFVVGAYAGTRLAPLLLSQGAHSTDAPLLSLVGALLGGGVLAGAAERIASRVRSAIPIPGLRVIDGLLGAALTACVALGLVWIAGAVALQNAVPGTLGDALRRSAILSDLDSVLPPSGPILNALARLDPLPSLRGPTADVAAPTRGILARGGVRAAGRSVVRVTGTACGLGIEGSGWAVGPGLVVTNAHVIAGEHDTTVQVGGVGVSRPAAVLAFDVHDDVAVLRVPGLSVRALAFAPGPRSGTAAAILGYPQDGGYHAEPGRLGRTSVVATQDAYGSGHVLRSLTALRGHVRPGNSGGPIVDGRGRVLATVFAAITSSGHAGGFAVPNRIVRRQLALARRSGGVGTGHCSA